MYGINVCLCVFTLPLSLALIATLDTHTRARASVHLHIKAFLRASSSNTAARRRRRGRITVSPAVDRICQQSAYTCMICCATGLSLSTSPQHEVCTQPLMLAYTQRQAREFMPGYRCFLARGYKCMCTREALVEEAIFPEADYSTRGLSWKLCALLCAINALHEGYRQEAARRGEGDECYWAIACCGELFRFRN